MAKNAVGKGWFLKKNYDNTLNSAFQNGDKPGGSGSSIVFQSDLSSFSGWDNVGSAWSIQSDTTGTFARCSYNGQNTGPYQLRKNLPTQGIREYFIAFDVRQSNTTVTSKLLKFFGVNNGTNPVSNNTWNTQYGGTYAGVSYGNDPTGSNDTQCNLRFNLPDSDTRSAATKVTIFKKYEDLNSSTNWRRFYYHWKQNSNGTTPDGEVQVYVDNLDGNGPQLWMDIRGIYNRGDNSPGFSYFVFGDYTSVSTPFTLDIKNVKFSHTEMPWEVNPFSTLYQEDWESATTGSAIDGRLWTSSGSTGRWGRGAGSVNASIQTAQPFTGTKSCRIQYAAGTGYAGQAAFDLGAHYNEVRITMRLFIPSNWKHRYMGSSATNNKIFRLWGDDGLGGQSNNYNSLEKVGASYWRSNDFSSTLQIDWNSGDGIGPKGGSFANFISTADLGKFMKIEIYCKQSSGLGIANGIIRVKKNDAIAMNLTNVNNWTTGQRHGYRYGYLLGWANTGFDELTAFYLDNILFEVNGYVGA